MASTTTHNLLLFHRMESIVFQRVKQTGRNSTLSKNLVSLWMWLERMGFPNIILRVKDSTPGVLQHSLLEGEVTLDCLFQGSPRPSRNKSALALTTEGIKQPITLCFFYENPQVVVRSMVGILDGVGRVIFNDELITAVKDVEYGFELNPKIASALQAPYVEMVEMRDEEERSLMITYYSGVQLTDKAIRDHFTWGWGVRVEKVEFKLEAEEKYCRRVVFTSSSFLPLLLKGADYKEFDVDGRLMCGRRKM